jgi:hypothetical protein
MKDDRQVLLSRRQFARRAALLSATASLVSAGAMLPPPLRASETEQLPANYPKLSPEGQAEAEARYQLVLSRHGSKLTEEQKSSTRLMCFLAQPGLEHVRAYSLNNGDVPALFLKPIVERERPAATKVAGTPTAATPHKP